MIFDVHAHYDDEAFDADRDELLQALNSKGVCAVVNGATDIKTALFGIEYAEKFPFMWTSAGFHPECAEKAADGYLDEISEILKHKKAVAVGEIGLDYHWQEVPREVQITVFEQQLALSKDLDLPVVVHDREAHADTLELLKKYRPKGFVHCFSGSAELAKEIVRLGMSISMGGVVTFKNARHSVNVVKEIPPDRLLLETDAPYLSPVPYRGKRCDSSMIIYSAAKIAEIRGISLDELLRINTDNACKMFNITL
ncbi:MAG: TatD family hydrolase [Acutalibacteraceae bacterium]